MTTRGHREILIGIEVENITTEFPRVDLTKATAEIKASQPDNAELQALSVPDTVGGEVHILLGIQYTAHFPRLVHSLESGLSIYEVRLTLSSPHVMAAIAGHHHSFNLPLKPTSQVNPYVLLLTLTRSSMLSILRNVTLTSRPCETTRVPWKASYRSSTDARSVATARRAERLMRQKGCH
jgi:hypothetical protein